jgi:hypothetical protein
MKNITISVDEETYRRARLWAADRGTSVSAVVKCILTTLPARAYTPSRNNSGVQPPVAPATMPEKNLIPSWGLSVLRATSAQFPQEKEGEEGRESSAE